MKYKAVVKNNDHSSKGCPYVGCIKVVCAEVFGYAHDLRNDRSVQGVFDSLLESDWIEPEYKSNMDFLVPQPGVQVYIEQVSTGEWIWTGFVAGPPSKSIDGKDVFNSPFSISNNADRIIGLSNGTYLRMTDGVEGKVRVEVLGPNDENKDRRGPVFLIDGAQNANKIMLVSADDTLSLMINQKDGEREVSLVDSTNKNSLVMDQSGVKLKHDKALVELSDSIAKMTFDNKGSAELTSSDAKLKFESKAAVELNGSISKLKFDTAEITASDSLVEIKAPGKTIRAKGTPGPPNGQGCFCALMACMFTGITHMTDTMTGT